MAVDEEENVVVRMIYSAAALRSETLDLGGKGICEIPKEILDLKYLESLHLEGNYITELPKDFFEKLTNLKWLDLRNNRLSALPISIGRHRTLRSLLLEGNSLTHLPCELGMVKSLCGLNLFSNPLEFPPPFIVKKGTQEILKYLREMCKKTDEKSGSSDQESEMDYFNSGVDDLEFPDDENSGPGHYSAGSQRPPAEAPNGGKMAAFKLPPIVRNATVVRRSNADVSDERESIQGQTVRKFEPTRRSTWEPATMPPLNDAGTEARAQKRRSKQDERAFRLKNESMGVKKKVDDDEKPSRDEKISDSLKKVKIKKKRSSKKVKKVHLDDGVRARFSVLVGDMVVIKVPEKHLIKGQPCVGRVVAEADDRGIVMVHYYIGTYGGVFREMMSRSSPYLRQVPLANILCKFEMEADGRVSPRTAIRIRQIVERPESG